MENAMEGLGVTSGRRDNKGRDLTGSKPSMLEEK
jgi:hypothetical protein